MNLRGVPPRIRLDQESAQPEAKVAGHREILATVMKAEQICKFTHLNLTSTLFLHKSVSIQGAHNQHHDVVRYYLQ